MSYASHATMCYFSHVYVRVLTGRRCCGRRTTGGRTPVRARVGGSLGARGRVKLQFTLPAAPAQARGASVAAMVGAGAGGLEV